MAVGDFKGVMGTVTLSSSPETVVTLQPAAGEVWLVKGIWAINAGAANEDKRIWVELYDGANSVIPVMTAATGTSLRGITTGSCAFNTASATGTTNSASVWRLCNQGNTDHGTDGGTYTSNKHYKDHYWSNWGGTFTIDNSIYLRLRTSGATSGGKVDYYIDAVQIK